jgi:hypothetical protein
MIMQLTALANDLPPAPIMEACERIGFLGSTDVGWSKVSTLHSHRSSWFTRFTSRLMAAPQIPGATRCPEIVCTCGEHYVLLLKYRFTLDTGAKLDYRIGQCERCRTIHWDDV